MCVHVSSGGHRHRFGSIIPSKKPQMAPEKKGAMGGRIIAFPRQHRDRTCNSRIARGTPETQWPATIRDTWGAPGYAPGQRDATLLADCTAERASGRVSFSALRGRICTLRTRWTGMTRSREQKCSDAGRTLANVNVCAFAPGDSMLCNRIDVAGTAYAGTLTLPPHSATVLLRR